MSFFCIFCPFLSFFCLKTDFSLRFLCSEHHITAAGNTYARMGRHRRYWAFRQQSVTHIDLLYLNLRDTIDFLFHKAIYDFNIYHLFYHLAIDRVNLVATDDEYLVADEHLGSHSILAVYDSFVHTGNYLRCARADA